MIYSDNLTDEEMDARIATQEAFTLTIMSREFLKSTDWKLSRHNDEILSNATTSLNPAELAELLALRQAARDAIT